MKRMKWALLVTLAVGMVAGLHGVRTERRECAGAKSTVMDTLVPVLKGSGVTTIFVEHDMDVIQRYAKRVQVRSSPLAAGGRPPRPRRTGGDSPERAAGPGAGRPAGRTVHLALCPSTSRPATSWASWAATALRRPAVWGSGAPHSSDVLREEVVDEGLVAKPTPLGLTPHGVENVRIDPNGDQSPGGRPQGGPPHAAHRSELCRRSLRDVGEVNPGTPHTPPAPCGSPGAR
jgi:hypothetical protein